MSDDYNTGIARAAQRGLYRHGAATLGNALSWIEPPGTLNGIHGQAFSALR